MEKEEENSTEQEESNVAPNHTNKMPKDVEKMAALLNKFTPEQQNRYEAYRRSKFQPASIKKLMSSSTDNSINQAIHPAMGGIAKLFVGELIEGARTTMVEWNETGPIRPEHIRESHRRLRLQGKIPYARPRYKKRFFKR